MAQNPNLASYSLNSNGIMNNQSEAINNGVEQSGGFDKDGRLTLMFDPSAKEEKGKFIGLVSDLAKVGINYFGSGIITTSGVADDKKVIDIKTNQAKETGETVNLIGHSAGGRRNYINILNSTPNQYLDENGRSVLNLVYNGTPANSLNLENAANLSSANLVQINNNNGDFVGNILGANGGVVQGGWSAVNVVSLFELPIKPDLEKFSQLISGENNAPTTLGDYFNSLTSPHSNYFCQGSQCNYNTNKSNSK